MKINAIKGTKDILPVEQKLRDFVQSKILETYRAFGFERISTPMLEDAENLDKSEGGDNLNLIFKVLKRGEKLQTAINSSEINEKELSDMGLRYDLTLPLTRFFACNKNSLQFPFKVIQTDRVFRAERPQKGRGREFVQCDIDILGEKSVNAEVELIDVTANALFNIGFTNFKININDRRILRNMLENFGFDEENIDSVCVTFDKLDKIGVDGIKNELNEKSFNKNAIEKLVNFVSKEKILLEDVASECSDSSIADDLKYVISTVQKISNNKYEIEYCPSLVRGQGYYTGIVFEIASSDFSGAVGGGGRYDNLIGKFSGEQIPAVGFSIGFERICSILLDKKFIIPNEKQKCAFLYDQNDDFVFVMSEAKKLQSDFSVSVLKKAKKLGSQYDLLEKQGYTKFATIKDGCVVLK